MDRGQLGKNGPNVETMSNVETIPRFGPGNVDHQNQQMEVVNVLEEISNVRRVRKRKKSSTSYGPSGQNGAIAPTKGSNMKHVTEHVVNPDSVTVKTPKNEIARKRVWHLVNGRIVVACRKSNTVVRNPSLGVVRTVRKWSSASIRLVSLKDVQQRSHR